MTSPLEVSDLIREGAVPLCVLARDLPPARGKKRSATTLVRWAREGVRGLRLEAFFDGGRWFSSRPALARFLAGVTAVQRPARGGATRTVGDEERAERKRREVDAGIQAILDRGRGGARRR